jgi:hypothetical protein
MTDQRDETTDQPSEQATEPDAAAHVTDDRRALTSDDFLVPGPSPQSNEGLARWGFTWLAFSILLILLMLCVSFVCLTLANWTGVA